MTAMPCAFKIPGIGIFRLTFDLTTIESDVPKDKLEHVLPMPELKACSHKFRLERIERTGGSRIKVSCLPDKRALKLLKLRQTHLGTYAIKHVQIAADDFDYGNDEAAVKANRNAVLRIMNKYNHRRGYIRAVDRDENGKRLTPQEAKRRGVIPNDFTVYFEPTKKRKRDGKQNQPATDLVIYIRREKLAQGAFGELGIHMEFKLSGERAIVGHLGGDQLDDLINADLMAFIKNNLILEKLDREKLARLIMPKPVALLKRAGRRKARSRTARQMNDAEYRLRRTRHWLTLYCQGDDEGPMPEDIWGSSPAQVRGWWRAHLKKQARKQAKGPAPSRARRKRLTKRKLDACFVRIPIEEVE